MKRKEISYDGGMSKNLILDENYENDFIQIKGYEKWTKYRNDWNAICKMEKEVNFMGCLMKKAIHKTGL